MTLSWTNKKWKTSYSKSLALATFSFFIVLVLGFLLLAGNKRIAPSFISQRTQPLMLSLESPIDGQVITDNTLIVKGKTFPMSTVVIFTEKSITSVDSNVNGHFEKTINLTTGLNKLTISSFAENGGEKTIALDVVYNSRVKGEKTAEEGGKSKEQPPGQEKKEEQSPSQEQPKQEAPAQMKKEEVLQTAIIGNVEKVTSDTVVVEEKKLKKKD